MGILIELLLITVLFVLISMQTTEVRLYKKGILYVDVSLTIFKFTIDLSGKRKNKNPLPLIKRLRLYQRIFEEIILLTSGTRIAIRGLKFYYSGSLIVKTLEAILIPSLITYASSQTEIEISRDAESTDIDIATEIPLYRVFIFLFKVLYFYITSSIGERKNVAE